MRRAGEAILPHWRADVAVRSKADESPVTAADLSAHHILEAGLRALAPDIPVLSEEDCEVPLSERGHWRRWWLVDPLDGTKEFISGSEEFTVNVALVEDGRVLFGLVGVPVSGRCYYGGAGLGAWREGRPMAARNRSVCAWSPRRPSPWWPASAMAARPRSACWMALSERFGDLRRASIGSSLKFCLLAEGAADCYPRLTPTSQWDTAAAQGVLEGAGGEVLDLHGAPFTYEPREDYLNGSFLALPRAAEWRSELIQLARALH